MLLPIEIPSSIDSIPIPAGISARIELARERIQAFQDRWDRPQIEQFVAGDYDLVWQTLQWITDTVPRTGQRFLEWGCGFAVVSGLAAELGYDAIGIEAEIDLLQEGMKTIEQWKSIDSNPTNVELIHGNFLPPGADSLADDPTLPSLGHPLPEAYSKLGLNLDDFAIVYSYPWPGEDDFHELVFDRYAESGALLIQFCGPNDVRVSRKANSPNHSLNRAF